MQTCMVCCCFDELICLASDIGHASFLGEACIAVAHTVDAHAAVAASSLLALEVCEGALGESAGGFRATGEDRLSKRFAAMEKALADVLDGVQGASNLSVGNAPVHIALGVDDGSARVLEHLAALLQIVASIEERLAGVQLNTHHRSVVFTGRERRDVV